MHGLVLVAANVSASEERADCTDLSLKLAISASGECFIIVESEGSAGWETERMIFDTAAGKGVVHYAKASTRGYFSGSSMEELAKAYLSTQPDAIKDKGAYGDYRYAVVPLSRGGGDLECIVFQREGM